MESSAFHQVTGQQYQFSRRRRTADSDLLGDLRPLKSCLVTDQLEMGNMDDIINSLSKYDLYSTFDISSGFWGLAVREQDIKYLVGKDTGTCLS